MKGRLRRSTIALVLGASLLTAAPATSIAASPVPEDFSAADQYVESIPTSEGSKPAKPEKGGSTPVPNTGAPPLQSSRGKLEQAVTSPELGAPRQRLHSAQAEEPGVPSAVVNAVEGGDGGSLLLLLSLLLVSGVVAGTAGHRHYRNRHLTREG